MHKRANSQANEKTDDKNKKQSNKLVSQLKKCITPVNSLLDSNNCLTRNIKLPTNDNTVLSQGVL